MNRSGGSPRRGRARGAGLQRSARDRLLKVLAGTAAAAALAVAAPALAAAVTISPLPGTPDASPQTQISILGSAPSNIAGVTVTGSISGVHSGHLEAYSNGEGASYLLDQPLTEGEEVNVTVTLKEGAPLSDSFTVAHLAPAQELLHVDGEKPEDQQHFKSAPELHPPIVTVNKGEAPASEGDFFLDPLPAPIIHVGRKLLEFEPVGPDGLMLLNPEGKLLYWRQLPGEAASNFEPVTYEGQKDIAWWQGKVTEAAFGLGEGVIANSSYEAVARIRAGNGEAMDIHELYVTPEGQAWIDAYQLDCLPACSESNPPTVDAVAQEIDIKTGLVMWDWHAMTYIPTSESEVEAAGGVFDAYHINSIQPLPEHRVLISLRDTSGVYDVNSETGKIVWQIAGKKSSFKMAKETRFYFQHDVRLEGKKLSTLTLFDDEGGPPIYGPSRGLVLKLSKTKVSLVHQYRRETTSAQAEGSMQVLSSGDVVVGFGNTPYFSEFTEKGGKQKSGNLVFDAQLPKGDGTYRVLQYPFEGTPKSPPAIAAERVSPGEVAVYASWNGATNVASWEVLAGETPETLAPVGTSRWANFETEMTVASTDSMFEVRALNKEGKVIGSSAAIPAS